MSKISIKIANIVEGNKLNIELKLMYRFVLYSIVSQADNETAYMKGSTCHDWGCVEM